jgi:4-alpha-glucanotransferase
VARKICTIRLAMRSPISPPSTPRTVDFHRWLQWQLDDQLTAAQATAVQAGMELGVMHDLAVGVDPNGADAWVAAGRAGARRHRGRTARRVQPARPGLVAAAMAAPINWWTTAYEPFRALVNAVLRHAGGVRIDHIIGLFRLWWIPKGALPTDGTTCATTTKR